MSMLVAKSIQGPDSFSGLMIGCQMSFILCTDLPYSLGCARVHVLSDDGGMWFLDETANTAP